MFPFTSPKSCSRSLAFAALWFSSSLALILCLWFFWCLPSLLIASQQLIVKTSYSIGKDVTLIVDVLLIAIPYWALMIFGYCSQQMTTLHPVSAANSILQAKLLFPAPQHSWIKLTAAWWSFAVEHRSPEYCASTAKLVINQTAKTTSSQFGLFSPNT